jgi:5-methylcytosine-specific restriction endonuclease McrA
MDEIYSMSFRVLKRLLSRQDRTSREKMITFCTEWIQRQSMIHPKVNDRPVPKMIRGEVWKRYHGTSTIGQCYCCKRHLDAFDTWNVGHVVSRAYGGSSTVNNLRPLCMACNMAMGTDHLYEFKKKYYPTMPQDDVVASQCLLEPKDYSI